MNPSQGSNPFADLNARFDQNRLNSLNQQTVPQPKQNTNTHGNFWSHLLPTLGGTVGGVGGGAAGGALAGTAILPGIGTVAGGLIGALLGGAAGGAGGKVLENHVEHQALGNGVAGQALEQGALSAGPLRLLKGAGAVAKAAPEVATGAKTLAEAISGAGESAAKPLFGNTAKDLITQGQAAQGRVAGVSAGSKITGKELTPQDTAAMLQTLKTEGIKTGNANNTLRDIQNKINQYGSQISDHFTANNTPLKPGDTQALADSYLSSLKTTDPGVLKQADILVNDLKNNVQDTKGLWDFRKTLDSKIPDSKQGATLAVSNKIEAVKGLRQFIANQLDSTPAMASYHNLSEIKPFISAEAKRLNNPGGGIIGRVAASGPVQKTEQLLGKATEKAGNTLQGTANPFGLASVASRTVPVGMIQAGASSIPQSQADMTMTNSDMMNNQNSNATIPGLSQNNQEMSSANSPYSQEALLYDISRDPNNAAKYISTYQTLDKIFNPAPAGSSVKPSNQQLGLAQTGVQQLQQLAGMIDQNPNVVNANATPGQGLPIVGSLLTNASGAGGYHALADSVMQNLLHLQTGAAASREEIAQAKGQLPLPGDSPQVRAQKISNLMNEFNNYLSGNRMAAGIADTGSGQPTDLASALTALGYGG